MTATTITTTTTAPALDGEPASHVLVTGGSRGLGRALVVGLLEAGYAVTSVSRSRPADLADLEERARRSGGRLQTLALDLAAADPAEVIARAEDHAPLYALINNAALAVEGLEGLVALADPEHIEAMVHLNLVVPMLLSRAAVKAMMPRRRGRVVNVGSLGGSRALRGLAVYGATKAGLEHFTRGLATEVGSRGITVNAVAPGFLRTDMTDSMDPDLRDRLERRAPIRRFPELEEVCGAVLYLLSPGAAAVTGHVLAVDGGSSL